MNRISDLLRQAQAVKDNIKELNSKSEEISYLGESKDGLVEITLSGKFEPQFVKIKAEVLDVSQIKDLESSVLGSIKMARDLTHNDYKSKLKNLTGGIEPPPGLALPF